MERKRGTDKIGSRAKKRERVEEVLVWSGTGIGSSKGQARALVGPTFTTPSIFLL